MNDAFGWSSVVFTLANWPVTVAGLAILAVFGLLLATLILVWRNGTAQRRALADAQQRTATAQSHLSDVLKAQADLQGRLATMTDMLGSRHSELSNALSQRMDAMTSRLGQSMSEQQRAAHTNLSKLHERLAVIDTAQTNIQKLAGEVVELQSILSNKQTRGAFGQSRMETIIADALPIGGYEFQATLSNNSRPDCIVAMPNDAPGLVIDAKFPLEAWNAMRQAREDDAKSAAAKAFARDMDVHIKAIADKYLLAGETQDTAFLFVPSESIFADLHEHHEQIIQRAHRARIVIVSPSLMMLSVQVIQALLKDARMREQAHIIQAEVGRLMVDLGRLDERVRRLQTHFGQTTKDVDEILVTTGKLTRRGQKIEALEFEEPAPPAQPETPDQAAKEKTGPLRLRVVDGEGE